ncbi:hypothetical protein NOR_03236 [Metarhizium rileyi]|uniref:Uncharacterized protein n=1 Tax=Metarhizium rileyi (strain RCEF 4871) TaxID=1649241 RepID=A0A167FLK1_METRR|nr:hypothetical protein NOR_03236 [Metarhizium rileyi RCEF 4871]TWU78316.1 hypothetical protein ED733_008465 [Metarhizium rileyi]
MYIFNRSSIIEKLGVPALAATARHHVYIREPELNPEARYGIMIALAISSGAFFVACIGLTISLCDWRMRYLNLRKELDQRGYIVAARSAAQQDNQVGDAQGEEGQAQTAEELAPRASGAL